MKIGKSAQSPLVTTPASGTPAANPNGASSATGAPAKSSAAASENSTVALSSTATTLLASGSTAEFDAGKVASVSSAIEKGQYKINAGTIADKLIANAKEQLGKVQS